MVSQTLECGLLPKNPTYGSRPDWSYLDSPTMSLKSQRNGFVVKQCFEHSHRLYFYHVGLQNRPPLTY